MKQNFEKIDLNLQNEILTIKVKEHPIINQLIITGEKVINIKSKSKK